MIQAIVPSAGKGERLGSRVEKPYVLLTGIPIVVRTLRVLESVKEISSILLVVSRSWYKRIQKEILQPYRLKRVSSVIIGGETRMESVYAGLSSLDQRTHLVLVHDAARPLVRIGEILKLIYWAEQVRAVCSGVMPKDTIKEVNGASWVQKTLDRKNLRAILTPQVFRREILIKAYEHAFKEGYTGTDDSSLVERLGVKIKVIEGDRENIKITTPEDLVLAEAILKKRRDRGEKH